MKKYFSLLIFFLPFISKSQDVWNLKLVIFFKLPVGRSFGKTMGVAINSDQHVFVFHRGPGNLMEFDEPRNFIRTIGDGFIKKTHGLRIDAKDNIWVTDLEQHIVIRFNPKGKITLVLQKANNAGEWNKTYDIPLFNLPADIAFDSEGNIYVADGYGNSSVVKFDKNGNYLKFWGIKGSGKGEFNLVHNVVIDSKDVVYVVDRENKRIQLFNTNGNYLSEWNNIGNPYSLVISNSTFYMTDGVNGSISKLDQSGKIIATYGQSGKAPGQFEMAHAIAVSSNKQIFVADAINWWVQCLSIR